MEGLLSYIIVGLDDKGKISKEKEDKSLPVYCAAQKIRTALKDEAPQIRRNGEGLIDFMKHYKKSM